ncbi:hypothetical protein MMC10_010195 [Thelotrema lepadinum]|nr:hypothetical protein [Thelotrema lepadinum]
MAAFLEADTNDPISRYQAANASFPQPRVRYTVNRYFTTGTSVLQNGGSSGQGTSSLHPSLAALTIGSYSTGTGSVSTSRAAREGVNVLGFDEVDIPVIQPYSGPVIYECPFDKLDCYLAFHTFDDWYNHSLTHFKTGNGHRVAPPTRNHCPFCDAVFNAASGLNSWRLRMDHVRLHHNNGVRLTRTGRMHHELYRHLWGSGVIDELEFKEITGGGSASRPTRAYPSPPTSPSTASANSNGGAYTESNRRRFQRPGGGRR